MYRIELADGDGGASLGGGGAELGPLGLVVDRLGLLVLLQELIEEFVAPRPNLLGGILAHLGGVVM